MRKLKIKSDLYSSENLFHKAPNLKPPRMDLRKRKTLDDPDLDNEDLNEEDIDLEKEA